MSEIDQQFIEYVVKSLVGKPEAVHIDRRIDEKGVLLELTVDPEDLGRVIGKRGATAQSLRTLLRALGTKNDARYNLKIVDNGPAEGGAKPAPRDDSKKPKKQSDDDADQTTATVDDAPVSVPKEEKPEETEIQETTTSDRLRQAREELSDLDDLDI
jgi:predicted RNA-binding protein YlqC (UPF0109 family)